MLSFVECPVEPVPFCFCLLHLGPVYYSLNCTYLVRFQSLLQVIKLTQIPLQKKLDCIVTYFFEVLTSQGLELFPLLFNLGPLVPPFVFVLVF